MTIVQTLAYYEHWNSEVWTVSATEAAPPDQIDYHQSLKSHTVGVKIKFPFTIGLSTVYRLTVLVPCTV